MMFCGQPDCEKCFALYAAVVNYLAETATRELIPEIEQYLKERNDR